METNNMETPKPKEPTTPKELSSIDQFLTNVFRLEKYVAYKLKQDFFFDTRSERTNLIIKALAEFTHENPALYADASNQGKRYQTFGAMLLAVNEGLYNCGCKANQFIHTIDKTTYVVTIITHESEQYLRSVTMIPEIYNKMGKEVPINNDCQAHGGAQTYMKRYALKSILGIEVDKDDDGQ